MSVPTSLFFQDLDGLTEVFSRTSARTGRPAKNFLFGLLFFSSDNCGHKNSSENVYVGL